MNLGEIAKRGRVWVTVGLIAAGSCLPLSAYRQGSYFLFDLRDDATAVKGTAGRIVVASSVFERKAAETKARSTGGESKSEFQTEITSFRNDEGGSLETGIEILDTGKQGAENKSAFGENAPAPSGFFFTY